MKTYNQIAGSLLIIIFIGFISSVSTGCYKDNEEELYPAGCDTTEVLYTTHVEPIIQNFCYACHGTSVFSALGGSVQLEGFDKLSIYVTNGKILSTIKHEAGINPMPQNASQLGECSINTIEAWINQGALNN